jgi:hypothetical protein
MTLEELLVECNKDAPMQAQVAPSVAFDPYSLPWWVVVVNPRRIPRKPKFVASFASQAGADAERHRREEMEAERVADIRELQDPKHEPYTFHVIQRPESGEL